MDEPVIIIDEPNTLIWVDWNCETESGAIEYMSGKRDGLVIPYNGGEITVDPRERAELIEAIRKEFGI